MENGSVDPENILTTQTVDGGLTQFSYHFSDQGWFLSFPSIFSPFNSVMISTFILSN